MRSLNFNYVVVRNGADYGKLSPAQNSAPTVKMSENGAIKTSFAGDFLPTVYGFDNKPITGAEINWLSDLVRPEMIIDGEIYPLGVFLPATVQESSYVSGTKLRTLHVEAYDRCWMVQDHYTEASQYFAAGVNYIAAVEQMLTAAGIALISSQPTTMTLAEAREDWNIGTSYLNIVNQLLSEINYTPLWFNSSGSAVLMPAKVPTAENITHVFDLAEPSVLVRPNINRKTDVYSAPNVFICICSNADKANPMVARSENTNPQSALAIQRRGRRIAKVVNVDNIANQTELQAYADRLRNESLITSETIQLITGLLPGFGVGEVVGLISDGQMDVCIERSWSMELRAGGNMQHTLERVVVNLG